MNFALLFIIYTCLKCDIFSNLILFLHTVSVTNGKKKKRNEFFSLPFLRMKNIEQQAGLNIPSLVFLFLFLFTLIAPNSECL